jgi:hypothetical protein
MASVPNLRTNVLLRSEQSGGHVSITDWGRIAAASEGVEPPDWALQPVPEVIVVGPQIAWDG